MRRVRLPLLICVALVIAIIAYIRYADRADINAFQLPPGFHIEQFAHTPSPRMMAFSPGGVLLVTSTSEGTVVALPDPDHRGKAARSVTVLRNLNGPHGIAFHNGALYVAEVRTLKRYTWDDAQLKAGEGVKIADLPESL